MTASRLSSVGSLSHDHNRFYILTPNGVAVSGKFPTSLLGNYGPVKQKTISVLGFFLFVCFISAHVS